MTKVAQDQLPLETERPEKQPRVAFGGFVKPEMYDVFGEYDLSSLTDTEKAWMTPRHIKDYLFQRNFDDPCVVDRTALNGHEYNLIARSPKKLAETAFSRTLAADDVTE